MATEYRLSHTAAQIDEKLKKIDNLAAKNDLPTKTSDLINDSGFTTENYVNNYAQPKGDYALKNDIPVVPTNVSAFNNDAGYLTEHQSLDGYATELYVDNKIDAIPTPDVSGQIDTHNTSTDAHNDIRLLVEGLTTRLNALADSDDTTLDQMSEIVAYIKSNKTLIEQVTTNKVNVSDIINNLTTNVSNKPLSAAQGVALKALIDAIPSWAKAASKPKYTASEVGADASGTANSLVASHNTNTSAHSDIREEISELSATKADKSQGFFYIEGDSSSTTDTTNKVATWIGSHDEITEYFSGLTILYKVVTAGSTSTTLNINNLGAVTVVRNATTGISTACPVDGVLLLTYTVDSNGTAYWKTADYDANTKNAAGTSNKTGTKLFLVGGASQSSSGVTTYSNSNVYINTSNQLYSAKGFSGNLTGNADTATKATQDASGNVITDTYETKEDADAKFSQLLKTTVQTLTEEQKAQVRQNIDAVGSIDIPVKGRDYFTAADKEELIQELMIAIGTPVFGTVDLNNRISLSDNHLADGTYEIGFENADGEWVSIGTYEKGASQPETTNVTLNMELGIKLSKTDNTYETVSTDNTIVTGTYAASQYIDLDTTATYKIGMDFSNYRNISLCFFDENNNFVAYHADVIAGATGEDSIPAEHTIVIPDGATKVRLRMYMPINQYNTADYALKRSGLWMTKTTTGSTTTYTNWIPKSTDVDGSAYNGGKGYKENTRWSKSGGGDISATGVTVSGYIPVKTGDVIRIKNITMNRNESAANKCNICYFWSRTTTNGSSSDATVITNDFSGVFDSSGNLTQFTIPASLHPIYIRLNAAYIGADSILTINEEIPDDTPTTYTNLAIPSDSNWVEGKRYNSSNVLTDFTGGVITNYIDVSGMKNYIAVKGINLKGENGRIYTYSSQAETPNNYINTNTSSSIAVADYDSSVFIVPKSVFSNASNYLWRFGGHLVGTSADVIITIDEEIR